MNEKAKNIEELLASGRCAVVSTSGVSMMPMLRDGLDAVCIEPLKRAPLKYDVVLFCRDDMLVLHRIIKELEEGKYLICGDNSEAEDIVSEGDILGILSYYVRNGKQRKAEGFLYRIYAFYAVCSHKPRVYIRQLKRRAKRCR